MSCRIFLSIQKVNVGSSPISVIRYMPANAMLTYSELRYNVLRKYNKRTADGMHERMVIRSCALDSGSLTMDTELVRMSHCGSFVMDGRSGD